MAVTNASDPPAAAGSQLAISVRQLTKTFEEGDIAVHAVNGIDLDVAAGEVVLVMGPSGSGKTTLLLMLGAMLRPNGSVVIDGVDLATAPNGAYLRYEPPTSGSSSRTSTCSPHSAPARTSSSPATSPAPSVTPPAPRHRPPRPGRAPGTGSASGRPALGRREAARRRRPRPRQRPRRPARRRAHGQPRLRTWAAATSAGCCAASPPKTTAASSSSATTTACAKSPTASSGSRTVPSASCPW